MKFDVRARCMALGLSVFAGPIEAHENPRGLVEIEWPMQNIHRTLSAGYPTSFGLYAFHHRELPRVERIEGRRCVTASFLAFDVDDGFAFDIDEDVELELLVSSAGTRSFQLSYDRNAATQAIQKVMAPVATQGPLRRETLRLERARFANRGMGGSDIAVVAAGALVAPEAGEPNTLTVCSISLKRSNTTRVPAQFGQVDIRVLDEATGAPTPARMGLYDETGRAPLPSEDALLLDFYEAGVRHAYLPGTYHPYWLGTQRRTGPWPSDNRNVFYVDGHYRARVPAGTYHLAVAKGIEYRVVERTLKVEPDKLVQLTVGVPRWDDMPKHGWYSGDAHIHIARPESENERISKFLRAEDVHVANLLEMNNASESHFLQYAWGPEGQFRSGAHYIVPGVEGPRTTQLGHTISLNIRAPLHEREQYFLYHKFFEEYARQGGLSGYAHLGSGDFNEAWGLALDVPFGIVDFVEILQDESLRTELWYEFLNLGYHLTPVAGSDFPYFDQPGAVRSYAYVAGEFSTKAWFDALKAGHSFVTNGPMLTLAVNGEPMGSTLRLTRGDSVRIEATASMNPDIDALDRLELVIDGDVARTVPAPQGSSTIALRHELKAKSGFWLAVRAYGKNHAVSHSAPVYVEVGESGSWSAAKAPALVKTMRDRLKSLVETPILASNELEFWELGEDFAELWERQKPRIIERIADANHEYDALLRKILGGKAAHSGDGSDRITGDTQ